MFTPNRTLNTPAREAQLLALKIVGNTGTPVLSGPCSNFFTVTDNGVGDYTITPLKDAAEVPVVIASVLTTGVDIDEITPAVGSIQVTLIDATDGATPAEGDVELLIYFRSISEKF